MANAYYPIFANLNGRRCVIVGGGLVAQRKVITLLRFGARVKVVSPTVTKRLAAAVRRGAVTHVARRFRSHDLQGAWLVYAATDDHRINELVFRTATRRRILTNVVDQTPLCSFIAPSIVKRGDLVMAVSTGGASPTLAKLLRRALERLVGRDYAAMARLLESLRGVAKRALPRYDDRKHYFSRLVSGQVFRLVRRGRPRDARQAALKLLQRLGTNGFS